MKNKPGFPSILLFLTGLLCIGFLFFVGYRTLQEITSANKDLETVIEQVEKKQQEIKAAETKYEKAADTMQKTLDWKKQKASGSSGENARERDPSAADPSESKPSVFSQEYGSGTFSDTVSGETTALNGHVVGLDPGHQSYAVDMSATEPNGPGSSEMKTKSSTGTQGSYTGLPEYQLNLDIALGLRELLQNRGYQVVMTRTDNETAISNIERAQYVSEQGAEICVRIHANGDDSHTASGALTMAPSPQNPYVAELSEPSVKLSQCVLNAYCEATGFQNLGVQYYDNMTGLNWSSIPVTILEMGFMTHEYDDSQMSNPEFQELMIRGIADGIDAYFAG